MRSRSFWVTAISLTLLVPACGSPGVPPVATSTDLFADPARSVSPAAPTTSALPSSARSSPTSRPMPTVTATTRADGTIAITGLQLPTFLLAGDEAIWAGGVTQITRIDPATNSATPVVTDLPMNGHPAVGVGDSVWVVDWSETSTVVEYDAATGDELGRVQVGEAPLEPLVAFGSIWVPNHHDGTLSRIDPAARKVVATIEIGPAGEGGPEAMAPGAGLLWASAANAPGLVAIDPATNTVARRIEICAEGVAYLFERLWVWECNRPGIQVLDPETGAREGTVDLDASRSPAVVGDLLWLPRSGGGVGRTVMVAVDPQTLQVIDEVELDGTAHTLAVGFDSLWLGGPFNTEVLRVPFSVLDDR